MKNLYLLPLLLLHTVIGFAQPYANQDCIGAVPLCNSRYELPYSFNGIGQTEELYDRLRLYSTCLITGENNSAWYKLRFDSPGELRFSIIPYSNDDYDFAIYDISGLTCADIPTGIAPELRCNFSVSNGVPTGIDTGGIGTSAEPRGPHFLLPLQVDSGDVLYLVINNFTNNGQGFAIDFAGTTANMISEDSFVVTSGYSTILPDTIKVDMFFNQMFYCGTLSNDYSEFTLIDDLGDTLEVISLECDSILGHVVVNTLHPGHAVASVTVYYQDGFDGNIIIAQCSGAELIGTPKTFEARNGPGRLDFTTVQLADTITFTAVAHNTAQLSWYINDTLRGYGGTMYTNFNSYKPYRVCLVADYGYVADTVCKNYNTTGIYAVDALAAFKLYPNPTDGEVNITLPYGAAWIEVTDLSGKGIARFDGAVPNAHIAISTAALPQGLYLVRVATPHGIAVQKLHVIH